MCLPKSLFFRLSIGSPSSPFKAAAMWWTTHILLQGHLLTPLGQQLFPSTALFFSFPYEDSKYVVFGRLQNGLGKRIIEQATLVITTRKPIYLVLFLMGSWVERIWIWILTLLLAAWPWASHLASLNPGYKGILWKKLYRQNTKIATGTEHTLEGALFLFLLSLDLQSHTTDMESLLTSD